MPVCKKCDHGNYHGNTTQCPTCGEPNPDKLKEGEPPASPSMADQRGGERPAVSIDATGEEAAGPGRQKQDTAQHQNRVDSLEREVAEALEAQEELKRTMRVTELEWELAQIRLDVKTRRKDMQEGSRLFSLLTSVPADTPDATQVPIGQADSPKTAAAVSKEQGKVQNVNKHGGAHAGASGLYKTVIIYRIIPPQELL